MTNRYITLLVVLAVCLTVIPAVAGPSSRARAALPNLAVDPVSMNTTSVEPGGSFKVTAKTKNTGSAAAERFTVAAYLSFDPDYDPDDQLVSKTSIRRLARGSATSTKLTATVPGSAIAGPYFVVVCADATKRIKESNERNNCRGSEGEIEVRLEPTSADLIDQALSEGTIDEETALLYEAYAAFGDPRLPEAFEADEAGAAGEALPGALDEWESLSESTQASLAPFFIPPNYEGSWAAETESAPRLNENLEGSPFNGCKKDSPDPLDPLNGWDYLASPNGEFNIWWEIPNAATDSPRAHSLTTALTRDIWPKLTGLMGKPLSDGGATQPCRGPDDRIDVFLVEMKSLGVAPAYDRNPAPGYILIDRTPASGDFRITAAHELMHLIQHAYPLQSGFEEYRWLYEATAQWAEGFLYPTNTDALNWASKFINTPTLSLEDPTDKRYYGAWIFFWYMTNKVKGSDGQPLGSAAIRQVWNNVKSSGSLAAVDKVLPGGFASTWHEFAKYAWNRPPFDALFQDGGVPTQAAQQNEGDLSLRPDVIESFRSLDGSLPHLAAKYFHYNVPANGAKWISFENGIGSPAASIQAFYKLSSGQWRSEGWSGGGSLCRDEPNQDARELVLIVSNRDSNRGSAPLDLAGGEITLRDECPPEADFTLTADPAAVDLPVTGKAQSWIEVDREAGFDGEVSYTVSASHDEINALVGWNPLDSLSGALLTVEAKSELPLGTYEVTVTGQSGSLIRDVSVTVHARGKVIEWELVNSSVTANWNHTPRGEGLEFVALTWSNAAVAEYANTDYGEHYPINQVEVRVSSSLSGGMVANPTYIGSCRWRKGSENWEGNPGGTSNEMPTSCDTYGYLSWLSPDTSGVPPPPPFYVQVFWWHCPTSWCEFYVALASPSGAPLFASEAVLVGPYDGPCYHEPPLPCHHWPEARDDHNVIQELGSRSSRRQL